jgi:hypothetical protein
VAELLYPLILQMWEKEELPKQWKEGLLIKILKKGDLTKCGNWRGISRFSIPSKILTRIILNGIQVHVNTAIRQQQAGFWKHRSCVDQINTLEVYFRTKCRMECSIILNVGRF